MAEIIMAGDRSGAGRSYRRRAAQMVPVYIQCLRRK